MNKEEIINNAVKHCCICDNKKYGEFISINDEKYHLCCIEQLQRKNKQLNEVIEVLKKTNKLLIQQKGQLQEDLDMLNNRIMKLGV